MSRAKTPEEHAPVLGQFLGLLERNMASHPERLQPIDAYLVQRVQALTSGIKVDLEAALSSDDD